jgi:hypothetical protein
MGGGNWGKGAAPPPKPECKYLFSYIFVNFQEKINNGIFRDINIVQNVFTDEEIWV